MLLVVKFDAFLLQLAASPLERFELFRDCFCAPSPALDMCLLNLCALRHERSSHRITLGIGLFHEQLISPPLGQV